ncbi:MAG TPA: thioredoxin domain-containing protein [archaeon]|nr:thioredoxin domain-containing protein [archaeon]
MVFCIVAIVVFGILGIFSAKYRTYFKEALRCVARQATLRKCDTDFDNKIKSKIVSKLIGKSPKMAKFVYKRFSAISWVFVVIMFASIGLTVFGVVNAVLYGNCNGEESTELCLLNPGTTGDGGFSSIGGSITKELKAPSADDDPRIGGENSSVTIIEFGCLECKYTKKAEETRKALTEKYGNKVKIIFRNFPIPSHPLSREAAEASECADDQGKYWEYHDKMFENQKGMTIEKMKQLAVDVGIDGEEFNQCFDSGKFRDEVEKDRQDGLGAGIYGTPTFFINGMPIVGPAKIEEFTKIIDEELVNTGSAIQEVTMQKPVVDVCTE